MLKPLADDKEEPAAEEKPWWGNGGGKGAGKGVEDGTTQGKCFAFEATGQCETQQQGGTCFYAHVVNGVNKNYQPPKGKGKGGGGWGGASATGTNWGGAAAAQNANAQAAGGGGDGGRRVV